METTHQSTEYYKLLKDTMITIWDKIQSLQNSRGYAIATDPKAGHYYSKKSISMREAGEVFKLRITMMYAEWNDAINAGYINDSYEVFMNKSGIIGKFVTDIKIPAIDVEIGQVYITPLTPDGPNFILQVVGLPETSQNAEPELSLLSIPCNVVYSDWSDYKAGDIITPDFLETDILTLVK